MKGNEMSNKKKSAAGQFAKERDYWLNRLSGEWEKTVFPYDHPKHSEPGELKAIPILISSDGCSDLIRLSNGSDQRLFMILAAQLVLLLYKYSGITDIIVGAPIYKQEKEGEYINTMLPLRNTFESGITFKELLIQVRQTLAEAVAHQNYPMEALPEKLNLPVSGDEFPILDITVLLENIHDKRYIENIPTNMRFRFHRLEQGIEGILEYNSSRYSTSTVETIASRFSFLVHRMMARLDWNLSDIEILSEEERHKVLTVFNETGTNADAGIPEKNIIHLLFEEQTRKTPDKIAVVSEELAENRTGLEVRRLTYRALNEKANQMAAVLRARGVKPGTAAALLMEPAIDRVTAILAILKAGAAYLPLDPDWPEKRILAILDDTPVAAIVIQDKLLERFSFTALGNITAGNFIPHRTPPRPQIIDFDGLPIPDRTLVDYRKHHRFIGEAMARHVVTIQATRGCPYNCAYCHKIWPKKHVTRSAQKIFQEIRQCVDAGVRRFAFIDDIFNLDRKNSTKLLESIIKHNMDIQLFFPNGLRADILDKEFIDLMVEAGTVNIDVALESGSPRIQKRIGKNLDLDKFQMNVGYIAQKHPHVVLEMEMMLGFPGETRQEALMTLDFLKQSKWIHFPNLHILKIFPNTEMERLAFEQGISREAIEGSTNLAYHQLPETLPYPKAFAREIQSRIMTEYILDRERVLQVLPAQISTFTEEELVQKYDSYLPADINRFNDITRFFGVTEEELGHPELLPEDWMAAPEFNRRITKHFSSQTPGPGALKILLLDMSQFFSDMEENLLHSMSEEPLGLMTLLTYLNHTFGSRIDGRIFKSGVDFDNFAGLKKRVVAFQPELIGIRSLTYYKEFFHQTLSLLRQWGITAPIISGGPYATSDHTFVLQDPQLDLIAFGEGEHTLGELVEKMLENGKKIPSEEVLKNIRGIAFMTAEEKIRRKHHCREIMGFEQLEELSAGYPTENIQCRNRSEDLLYLISTSGSTGKPKTVMLEHRNLANLLQFQYTRTNIDFSKGVLQFAAIGFDVSAQEIFSTLLAGGVLYLADSNKKSDFYELFRWIEENRISILFLPPAVLNLIFSEPDYRAIFPKSVRHIIAAGEQLLVPEPLRNYLRENRIWLHNHYGPTETHVVTALTLDPAGDIPEIPSIGKPISNTGIYILDESSKPVPIGVPGELFIGGSNVGRGYSNRPELTAQTFLHLALNNRQLTLYRTGDRAKWLPDGSIKFLGRKDHQVKIRGFRIELGEIESRLRGIARIKDAVVIDRASPGGDRYLCAYVVSHEEPEMLKLRETLSAVLPDYMIPAYFVRLEKIPISTNGKVQRRLLPDPEIKSGENYTAPRDTVEKTLVEIWSGVLGIEKNAVGIDDNFFELGGNSLKATVLITRIHKQFDIKTSLGEIFNQPFIRELARHIRNADTHRFEAIEPVKQKDYYQLSSAQKRLYTAMQMELDNVIYNMPIALELEGHLNTALLEKTFQELIKRHECFRTSIRVVVNEPVQKVHDTVDFVAFSIETINRNRPINDIIAGFIRPFDLTQPPLLRAGLITNTAESHVLMIDMPHIVTDGTSMALFVKEFLMLYSGNTLPPLRIQYKDYSEWQHRMLNSGELEKQEHYWLNIFKGDIPELNMPTDYPRTGTRGFKGTEAVFKIKPILAANIHRAAAESESTLHIYLLAAFTVLLSKYSGQEDIVVGSGVAGRQHADLANVMGMFINMLPMRNFPEKHLTYREYLRNVRENALNAYANQDYQYEDLVMKLGLQGTAGRNPLFDFVFEVQNMEIPKAEIPGLKIRSLDQNFDITHFDMTVHVFTNENDIDIRVVYSTDLFKRETIVRMGDRYSEILEQVTGDSTITLENITLSQELVAVTSTLLQEEEDDFEF